MTNSVALTADKPMGELNMTYDAPGAKASEFRLSPKPIWLLSLHHHHWLRRESVQLWPASIEAFIRWSRWNHIRGLLLLATALDTGSLARASDLTEITAAILLD